MAFTFRVVFGGLNAFVPNPNGHQMRALVINATERLATNGQKVLPTHVPLFLFRSNNRRAQIGRKPWESKTLLSEVEIVDPAFRTGAFCAHRLERDELAIRNEEGGALDLPFSVRRSRKGQGGAPRSGEEDDFFWVPQMDHAFPGAGQINPAFLREDPPGAIAARLQLTEGTVSTASLAKQGSKNQLYIFREMAQGGGSRKEEGGVAFPHAAATAMLSLRASARSARAVATGVQWELKVPGDTVTVWSSRMGRPYERRWALSLGPAKGKNSVEAYVFNVSTRPVGETREVGEDFEFFYDLCASPWDLGKPRPVPHLVGPQGPQPHRPGTATCSPSSFEAHSEA